MPSALEATLAADQAQIENAQLNLQYTRILAPISGRTGALGVHEGDLVRANDTTPLVVINQVAPIYVTFSVPGRYLPTSAGIRRSSRSPIEARIQPAVHPGRRSRAADRRQHGRPGPTAARPAPTGEPSLGRPKPEPSASSTTAVDPTTGTIRMKGTFANADHALWPGLFVQVTLVLRTDPNAIVVPAAAVQASQAGQFVYVVKPDRTVEIRNVTVERQQGEEMVIAQGLAPGEEVVTDGQLRLTRRRARDDRHARRRRRRLAGASGRGSGDAAGGPADAGA